MNGKLSHRAVVKFRYRDSSVPPEFHRSYTLDVMSTELRAVVSAYGDVLHRAAASTPSEVWQHLGEGIGVVRSLPSPDPTSVQAPGGSYRWLEITDSGEQVVAVAYSGSDAAAVLDWYVTPALQTIPGWSQYVSPVPPIRRRWRPRWGMHRR
jgi:hypothetical protein